jgi:predicted transposase YbfD/YdcC
MPMSFVSLLSEVPDPRVAGMITYPMDEMLLAALVGVLCGGEDFDDVESIGNELLSWLRGFLPYEHGLAPAQTLRRVFRLLEAQALERILASWASSLIDPAAQVVAIDGKTLRASKRAADGSGALHLLCAYACEAGLVIGQRPCEAHSNEITAVPPLLDMLALKGAIVTLDAMGAQKDIAAAIALRGADYVLALKGNQGTLLDDVVGFFADPGLAGECSVHAETDAGHGRIEERVCRTSGGTDWLGRCHPGWTSLNTIAAVTATRVDKKTGAASSQTRYYIASLPPDPARLLKAVRSHWAIENNLHWQLDVTFDEDCCRMRKDHAANNFAAIRRIALNMLRKNPWAAPLKRKRLKALMNPSFRTQLLAC